VNQFSFILPLGILVGLFYVFRWLERLMHEHIFKVGWLVTKNYRTTTILYYIFFLPGVVLNQVVLWLAAGILNVRADRAIQWPAQQEVAELHLDFVKLTKKVSELKLAVIHTAPLVVGVLCVLFISNNLLRFGQVVPYLNQLTWDNAAQVLNFLTNAPDFWLWTYVMFTISNVMMPDFRNLRGWWRVAWVAVGVLGVAILLGFGNTFIVTMLNGPITVGINALSTMFVIIILADVIVLAVFGSIEAIIERITGDSATFKDGKLIAATRAELQAQQQAQREAQDKRQRQLIAKRLGAGAGAAAFALPSGAPANAPSSIYALPLPVPGAPGKELVTALPNAVLSAADKGGKGRREANKPTVINAPQVSGSLPATATKSELRREAAEDAP
jgi:hypothetical protein